MRAAVLHEAGPPERFRIETVADPVATDDEVLVRVQACGVSYHDVLARNGTYRRGIAFPMVLGMEIAGIVEHVGAQVTTLAPGDLVCTKAFASCGRCRYCRSGRETTCRSRRAIHGGYAELVAVPQDAAIRIPPNLPFEAACTLGPGAGVALNAVRDTSRVTIGETVLVTGASGGVGLPAVRLAKLAGARVVATTRSEAKRAAIERAGADLVLVQAPDAPLALVLRDMTDGEGVDVVIDTVGSAVFAAAFDALAPHGRYAMVGQLSGDEIKINPARIFFKRASLLGVGSVSRAQLEHVVRLVAAGTLEPQIAKIMPLEAIAEAHRLVESAAVSGRVVVVP